MITCYFGVPGVGKTTFLTKLAVKELERIKRGKSKYKAVYTNFECFGALKIKFEDLEKYVIFDSLLLFDELTMDADNRNFKSFKPEIRDFFILHRHTGCDIVYATQSYEMVDLKIRQLTADLWYMQKSVIPFFSRFTTAKKIYRNININEYTSELSLGYRFCNLAESFFTSNYKLCYRPNYYKYFDSFDPMVLADRPKLRSISWGTLKQNSVFSKLFSPDHAAKVDSGEKKLGKKESDSEMGEAVPKTTSVESPVFLQQVSKSKNVMIKRKN